MLASLSQREREKFYSQFSPAALAYLPHHWAFWARPTQLWPRGLWKGWVLLTGRGWGKTTTGANAVGDAVRKGYRRIRLIGRTEDDAWDEMVEGESGILNKLPSQLRPRAYKSRKLLIFPTGAIGRVFGAAKPDKLRGKQADFDWYEEVATWEKENALGYPDAWTQAQLGLRLGNDPRFVVTTTPRPTKLIKELKARAGVDCVVATGSTYENIKNLAQTYIQIIVKPYEGTRLGRQELQGEILEDVEGALWTMKMLDDTRVTEAPDAVRLVIPIDPAVTATPDSDETGIVPVAKGADGHYYVLADVSCRMSPTGWARRAIQQYHGLSADEIVGEVNNGGDLVQTNIHAVDANVRFKQVRASRGKETRAQPIANLFEQGRAHIVGRLPQLEEQMTSWVPEGSDFSPDRMDAMVWGITRLMEAGGVSSGLY